MFRKTIYDHKSLTRRIPNHRLAKLCEELSGILDMIDLQLKNTKLEKIDENIKLRALIKAYIFILRQLLDSTCLYFHKKNRNKYPKTFKSFYKKYNNAKNSKSEDWIIKDFYNIILQQDKAHWLKFYRDLIKDDYELHLENNRLGHFKILLYYNSDNAKIPSDMKIKKTPLRRMGHHIQFECLVSVFEGLKACIIRNID